MNPKVKKIRLALAVGLIALLIHGSVTYYVNADHGFARAFQAALAQGGVCFFATLCSAWFMQFFFDFGHNNLQRFVYASLGAGSLMLCFMVVVHWYMQTPELLTTVGSAALPAAPYYLLFPLFLIRQRSRQQAEEAEIRFFAIPYAPVEFVQVLQNNIFGPSAGNKTLVAACANPITLTEIDPQIRIGFIGDLMPLQGKSCSLDPSLLDFFTGIDYLVANFEGSLFASVKKGLLAQHHGKDILELISCILPPEKIILSCANNHAADFGRENFNTNNAYLEQHGFRVIGSASRPSTCIEGHIEIYAATEWSNQKQTYLAGVGTTRPDAGKTFTIFYPHWCYELELYPNQMQIERAKELLGQFDLIVGHHSHVPGIITTHIIDEKEKMVAYSLGDFTIAIGAGFKNYAWGQAMVIDFGPEKGAASSGRWQQGTTRWVYTKISRKSRNRTLQDDSMTDLTIAPVSDCPWFR
jgi:hypothetical protein